MSNVRGVLAAVLVLVLSGCHGVAPTTLVPKVRTAEAKLVSNAGANEVAAPEAAAQEVQDPATIQVATRAMTALTPQRKVAIIKANQDAQAQLAAQKAAEEAQAEAARKAFIKANQDARAQLAAARKKR